MPLPDGSDQGPYLRSIRFTRYDDVRVPAIALSNDGSLGRLACEIEAEGQEVAPEGRSLAAQRQRVQRTTVR